MSVTSSGGLGTASTNITEMLTRTRSPNEVDSIALSLNQTPVIAQKLQPLPPPSSNPLAHLLQTISEIPQRRALKSSDLDPPYTLGTSGRTRTVEVQAAAQSSRHSWQPLLWHHGTALFRQLLSHLRAMKHRTLLMHHLVPKVVQCLAPGRYRSHRPACLRFCRPQVP
jgi:hypothetical protein